MKKFLFMLAIFCTAGAYAADVPVGSAGLSGKVLFAKTKCSTCHAADAKGSAPMAKVLKVAPEKMNLVAAGTEVKAEDLKTIISKGKDKMPKYENKLKPEEIDSLVAYIQSLSSDKKMP